MAYLHPPLLFAVQAGSLPKALELLTAGESVNDPNLLLQAVARGEAAPEGFGGTWGASPPAQSCLSISALPGGLLAVVEAASGRTGPLSEERNRASEENRCVLTVWRFGAGKV